MTTISEAFVTIRPDTKDFGKEAESGIQSAAGSIAKSGLFLGAAAGVAIAGALGKGLSDAINVEKANDKLSAQLGLTAEESERVGGLAGDLFADAYGGSLEEVNAAIAGVGRNIVELGSTSTGEIKDIAAQALDLAAVMDEDVGRVTRGVGQLMRNTSRPTRRPPSTSSPVLSLAPPVRPATSSTRSRSTRPTSSRSVSPASRRWG